LKYKRKFLREGALGFEQKKPISMEIATVSFVQQINMKNRRIEGD